MTDANVPEVLLDNPFYVPLATNYKKGIANYDDEQFTVIGGRVSIKHEYVQDAVEESLENAPDDWFVKSVNGKKGHVVLDASSVGADAEGSAKKEVASHNVDNNAHKDLRDALSRLDAIVTDLLDSDDETLNELHEIVAYIKSNRNYIEILGSRKVNVADIIDDLDTNAPDKPLSAAQGMELNTRIGELSTELDNLSARLEGYDDDVKTYVNTKFLGGEW